MTRWLKIERFDPQAFTEFDGTEVVVTPSMVLFWKPPNPFGQWTESPFVIGDIFYNCAEQFMMAEKARLFDDREIELQILQAMEPRKQKKLGQQVTGFRDDLWMVNRCDIVFRGNMAKFTQNPSLREVLLQTGDRQLVEASPLDKIWGIGLAANDPQAYDPCQWLGENLLGMVLERVRDHLRSSV
jgi:ribA/ribD-fused uncharacterized protein